MRSHPVVLADNRGPVTYFFAFRMSFLDGLAPFMAFISEAFMSGVCLEPLDFIGFFMACASAQIGRC